MFIRNAEEVEHFLTSFYQGDDEEPASLAKRMSLIVTHPVRTLAAIRYILTIPIVEVSIPEKDKSKAPWLYDPRRPWRLRGYISSYIELPSPIDLYWQGQAKQNLRKATARAIAAGFKVRPVEPLETSGVITQVFEDKGWGAHEIEKMQRNLHDSLEDGICVAVFDERDHVVAFCTGTQAGNTVRNVWANTSLKGQVRWLCFSGFVEEANARGARFIVESPPWSIAEGNRLFAARLGFIAGRIRSS